MQQHTRAQVVEADTASDGYPPSLKDLSSEVQDLDVSKLQLQIMVDVALAMFRDKRTTKQHVQEFADAMQASNLQPGATAEVELLLSLLRFETIDLQELKRIRSKVRDNTSRFGKTLETFGDVVLKPVDEWIRLATVDEQQYVFSQQCTTTCKTCPSSHR